jgi:hypothetical protein
MSNAGVSSGYRNPYRFLQLVRGPLLSGVPIEQAPQATSWSTFIQQPPAIPRPLPHIVSTDILSTLLCSNWILSILNYHVYKPHHYVASKCR